MQDYEMKKEIQNIGLDKLVRRCRWAIFKKEQYDYTGQVFATLKTDIPYDMAQAYIKDLETNNKEQLRVADNMNNALFHRKLRLQKRIEDFVYNNDCVFLTLTFRDDVLDSTSEDTRRKYVQRFLKEQFNDYVANIDYGDTTEREHYHAVVTGFVDRSAWEYGFSYTKKVVRKCPQALAKYITKLTYHALKESNITQHVIYSRNITKPEPRKGSEPLDPNYLKMTLQPYNKGAIIMIEQFSLQI